MTRGRMRPVRGAGAARARLLRVAGALGVDARWGDRIDEARLAAVARAAGELDGMLSPGAVALVTGPSGSGKSTLLRRLARACQARGERVEFVRPLTQRQQGCAVAALCVRTSVGRWCELLARLGLAEAGVMTRRAGALSAGERARLELALGAARCERGLHHMGGALGAQVTLIADEWCTLLDRATAAGVANGAARWAKERGVRVVAATCAGGSAVAACADVIGEVDEQGGVKWTSRERVTTTATGVAAGAGTALSAAG